MTTNSFGGRADEVRDTYEDYYEIPDYKRRKIGSDLGLNEYPNYATAYFKNNQLYLVQFFSIRFSAYHLDDLIKDCESFTREFTKIYGYPKHHNMNASILDFEDHELIISYYEIESTIVYVAIEEKNAEYRYKIIIKNNSFPRYG